MRILVVTNLYPPQELGGYGRCMADFVWGLQERGHSLQVICTDAPYLQVNDFADSRVGPSGEPVARELRLKGSYEVGVQMLQDPVACTAFDQFNASVLSRWLQRPWDGVLLGNLDLLGPELFPALLEFGVPLLHHVGFMSLPFAPHQMPSAPHYFLLAASNAVRDSLVKGGLPVAHAPVVYPGARTELFAPSVGHLSPALSFSLAAAREGQPLGSPANPLKVGFAGLLMGSKGVHTLVLALLAMHKQGFCVQASLAGGAFQAGYREQLEALLVEAGMDGLVRFVGQLDRPRLARFWALHHVGVFTSIHPEAFGIVAAEVMSSGVALITTGVGGAAELIESGMSGLRFEPGNSQSLFQALQTLISNPSVLEKLAMTGQKRAADYFSVRGSVVHLEQLFKGCAQPVRQSRMER